MSVLTVLIIGVFTLFLYYCYGIYRKNRQLEKIPGPPPIPFFGTKLPRDIYELHEMFDGFFKKYGKTCKVYIGNTLQVLTMDINLIEPILKSNVHTNKSDIYQLLGLWLKDGLIISAGDKWKRMRKLISPAFHFTTITNFFPIFKEATDTFVERLGEEADKGNAINVIEFTSKFALDVIGETSFGIKLNIQKGESKNYIKAVGDFLELVFVKHFSTWKRFPLLFKYFAPDSYSVQQKSLDILDTTAMNVIKERRKYYTNNLKANLNVNAEDNIYDKKCILVDALLQHQELTDDDILGEVNNFLFAGHDSTALALAYAFLELSQRPEIQEKLYEEINSYIHNDITQLSRETVLEMKYLDMVLKEVLRLRSPVPYIERKLMEDAMLGGTFFPKGTTIGLLLHWLQLDSDLYPDPQKFDPERFSPENQDKRSPFAFLPFSAGPRNCIGQRYAVMEMKTVLIRIILEFKIHPVEDFKFVFGLRALLHSKYGYPIKLERRKV